MVQCCVPSCGKRFGGFHSFPSDRITFQRWIKATKAFEVNDHENPSYSYDKVCKTHFRDSDYRFEGSKHLKKNAIPSVELPGNTVVDEHNYCLNGYTAMSTIPQTRKKIEIISMETFPPGYIDLNALRLGKETHSEKKDDSSTKMEIDSVLPNEGDPDTEFTVSDNVKPMRKKMKIEKTTETITINRAEYISLKRKLRYARTQLTIVKNKLKIHQKITRSPLFDHLMKDLNYDQITFLQLLLNNNGQKGRGRRYSFSEKSLALVWYKQSPKSYNFVSTIFPLPTYSILCTHSAKILFESGLNRHLLAFIKDAVSKLSERERLCILSWDEVSLKTGLEYLPTKQYIDGFLDLGSKRTDKFANHALTFMVRGVEIPYKQPVCYFLTNADIGAKELSELIELVIKAILDTGLIIIASVCDQVAVNAAAVNRLIKQSEVTVKDSKNSRVAVSVYGLKRRGRKPMLKTSKTEVLSYKVKEYVIVHVFDSPHIIKGIRNNVLTKNLKHFLKNNRAVNGKKRRVASWDDISEFYNSNNTGSVRRVEKLTDEHINPLKRKMNVKLATQVFSNSLGQSMRSWSQEMKETRKRKRGKQRDFTGTADILIFFNEVFDSLNGGKSMTNDTKGAVSVNSNHEFFWEYAITMLKKMEFVFKEGDHAGETSKRCKILDRLISTIRGFQQIKATLLRFGITSFSPRRFNQDGLENLFGLIRSICHIATAPTTRQFKTAYATIIVTGLMKRHSLKSNCEPDFDSSLLQNVNKLFAAIENSSKVRGCLNEDRNSLDDDNDDEDELLTDDAMTFLEDGTIGHVASIVCKKFLKAINCLQCKTDLQTKAAQVSDPKSTMVSRVKTIISKVEKIIPKICFEMNLKSKLLGILNLEGTLGCIFHCQQIALRFDSITIDFIISIFTKHVNEVLTEKILMPTNEFDIIQKNALEYRQKRKGIGKYVAKTNKKKIINPHL